MTASVKVILLDRRAELVAARAQSVALATMPGNTASNVLRELRNIASYESELGAISTLLL